jgi:dipeptidyl aminopeptidase/acylaminoacyl peptidase
LQTQPTERVVAPYGTWSSPISAELRASAATSLSTPWLAEGTVWWLEGRPTEAGRVVLMKVDPGGEPEDVTPAGFNVRTMAHEYGGGAHCIHDGVVYFSNFDDQRLYRQAPGQAPTPITPEVDDKRHRYADGCVTADGSLWLGVRERHEGDGPADVVNELVAIPTDGSREPRIVVGGRDFYAAPRVSPDGTKLSFLAWDLPWMPWDGCELFVAELSPEGELGEISHVAGRDGEESIWQPEWSPEGDLVFASDRSGWWNFERIRDGERQLLHPAEAEFGYPAWAFAMRSYDFLADGRLACTYDSGGRTTFAVLDPETGRLDDLDLPHDSTRSSGLVAEGDTIAFVAGSATIPNQVVRANVTTGTYDVVRTSSEVDIDTAEFSIPEAIEFPTEHGLTAHALYYAPRNLRYAAEEDELAPLIVMSHGGPTAHATALFSLEMQFWTTRGFAVVDVNYGGSTGYGRAYRERLNGMWGVVDLEDCVNAARYLVEQGAADPDRLLITGGSAGGYTTICALTFTDEFAGGASYFGLADLVPFASGDTHKFESRYEHTLVGPYPEAAELYRERSPINFVDRISTPMLVLQGEDDMVVPKSQAEVIVEALRERGVPYAYLLFPGEGHGFRKAENIVRSLHAELSFYAQVLGFEPGDSIPKLAVENLPD